MIFSGDLGCKNTPILPDPDTPDSCDLLILESTYGNRIHEGREERLQTLGGKTGQGFGRQGQSVYSCLLPWTNPGDFV